MPIKNDAKIITLILLIGFVVLIFHLTNRDRLDSSAEVKPTNTSATNENISLRSDREINYSQLQELLKKEKWKEADGETKYVMNKAIGKPGQLHWTPGDLLGFPSTDLKTINDLWLAYSGGRFGFSVQKKIYLEAGANLEEAIPDEVVLRDFYSRIGWFIKIAGNNLLAGYELTYSTAAPPGHLPGPFIGAIWIKTARGRSFWLNGSDSNLPEFWREQDDKDGLDAHFGLPLLLCHRDL